MNIKVEENFEAEREPMSPADVAGFNRLFAAMPQPQMPGWRIGEQRDERAIRSIAVGRKTICSPNQCAGAVRPRSCTPCWVRPSTMAGIRMTG